MSKSLKLKNNNYWDSKGIVHNKVLLNDILNFSTDEKKVGIWIDGKPIYEKTVSITLTQKGEYTVGQMVSTDIKYGTIICAFTSTMISTSLFNTIGATINSEIYVENRSGRGDKGYLMGCTDRDDMLNVTIYAVVRYTKTTD